MNLTASTTAHQDTFHVLSPALSTPPPRNACLGGVVAAEMVSEMM